VTDYDLFPFNLQFNLLTQGVFAALILNTLLYSAGLVLLVRFFLRVLWRPGVTA
jgi:hypothetical protein